LGSENFFTFDLPHYCHKASLDIFWLRDESLEESDNLRDPDVLAQEIVEDREAALNNSAKSPRIWLRRTMNRKAMPFEQLKGGSLFGALKISWNAF
jgi:hypothetical protein